MRLTKFSYYADYVIYPIAMVGLTAYDVGGTTSHIDAGGHAVRDWLCACASGVMLWTLFEYVLHRVALHRMPAFAPLHAAHHAAPLAFIGTPTWLSLTVWMGAIWLPVRLLVNLNIACALVVGVMLGFWWFGVVHHVIHHYAHRRSFALLDELRAWHMRHHHSPKHGNYGVTTTLWDHMFGTTINAPSKAVTSS